MAKHRSEKVRKETGYSASYLEFAKTLRTWFVGYGIGAPVLLLSNKELADVFLRTKEAGTCIANLFLFGVGVQLFVALLYKTIMWYLYVGEQDPKFQSKWRYRSSDIISEQLWLELLFDVITILCFGRATIQVMEVLFSYHALPGGS